MARTDTDTEREAMLAFAERLLERTQASDLEGMRELFSPDVVFWSNVGQRETPLEERMAFMALEQQVFEELNVEAVRIEPFDGGFVQQCVFAGKVVGGAEVRIPGCLVIRVEDERVVRFEEYISQDHIQPVIEAITGLLAEQTS